MDEPRKILFLNHVSRMSGAENSLLSLVAALNRKKFRPLLVCPGDGLLPDMVRKVEVATHYLPLKRLYRTINPFRLLAYGLHILRVARRIRKLVKAEGVSLVHANSTTAQIYGGLAAWMAGVPSVWHVRDLVPLGWLGAWLCRLSSRIVAISLAVARCVSPSCRYDERINVIHNGIHVESFRWHTRAGKIRGELGLTDGDRIVSMVGQIVPWKGHATFIRALAQIPEAVGLIVGNDLFGDHADLLNSLHALSRDLGVGDRIIFLGWRDDVPDILMDTDVLALPSEAEPFGRVALEAMALGKPVVGTLAGGLPEIVVQGKTGILVEPGDADQMAQAIRSLLNEPDVARAMGEAGLERVRSHFSVASCVHDIEEVYDELLGA